MLGDSFVDNEFQSELFARGYIFREHTSPEASDLWSRTEFGDFHLAHDPRLELRRERAAGCEVMSLGTIFDVRYSDETHDCIEHLASALADSEEAFLEEVGFTCGRYVLAYQRKDGSCFVIPDASGMKTIFYYCGAPRMIASHHNLLLGNAPHERLRDKIAIKFGYPGLRAPLQNSFLLTPNTKLNMSNFLVTRVWPKRPIVESSLAAATETVEQNMQAVVTQVLGKYKPIVSVTAGLDSRLTLSFLRDQPDIQFFTYYRNDDVDSDIHDIAFAQSLKEDLNINVNILKLRSISETKRDFLDVLDYNTYFSHIKRAAWAYYECYGSEEKAIHLRSNVSEVGREFWRGKKFAVKEGKDLARIYLYDGKEYKSSYVFNVIDHFEEFNNIVKLTDCAEFIDVKSLFYWEFRMASWHAQVVVESDPAFDTLSLFNCRNTLEAMLSVPLQERLDSMILRNIIAKRWPALSAYKVNGKPFWPSSRRAA